MQLFLFGLCLCLLHALVVFGLPVLPVGLGDGGALAAGGGSLACGIFLSGLGVGRVVCFQRVFAPAKGGNGVCNTICNTHNAVELIEDKISYGGKVLFDRTPRAVPLFPECVVCRVCGSQSARQRTQKRDDDADGVGVHHGVERRLCGCGNAGGGFIGEQCARCCSKQSNKDICVIGAELHNVCKPGKFRRGGAHSLKQTVQPGGIPAVLHGNDHFVCFFHHRAKACGQLLGQCTGQLGGVILESGHTAGEGLALGGHGVVIAPALFCCGLQRFRQQVVGYGHILHVLHGLAGIIGQHLIDVDARKRKLLDVHAGRLADVCHLLEVLRHAQQLCRAAAGCRYGIAQRKYGLAAVFGVFSGTDQQLVCPHKGCSVKGGAGCIRLHGSQRCIGFLGIAQQVGQAGAVGLQLLVVLHAGLQNLLARPGQCTGQLLRPGRNQADDGDLPGLKTGHYLILGLLGRALCFAACLFGIRAHLVGGFFALLPDLCAGLFCLLGGASGSLCSGLGGFAGGILGRAFQLLQALLGGAGVGHNAQHDLTVMFTRHVSPPPFRAAFRRPACAPE